MKQAGFIIAGILLFFNVLAQPVEERIIEPFNKIHLAGKVDVDLVKGEEALVKIRGVEGAQYEDIDAEVTGGQLKITSKLGLFKNMKIRATVFYTALDEISVSSNASVYSDSVLDTKTIKCIAKNGGMIDVKLNADTVRSSIFTGGLVALEGKTKYQQASVSSRGVLSAFNMVCETADITAKTNGTAKVNVKDFIKAEANIRALINIMGNPAKEIIETRMGGEIMRSEEE